MKKALFTTALLFLTVTTQAQLRFVPDYTQIGTRTGWQNQPFVGLHANVSIIALELRFQTADAWLAPTVGLDLGKIIQLQIGEGALSPIIHGYWIAGNGPGYRMGVNAQILSWNSTGWYLWNGLDLSAYYSNDPILGQGFGASIGINLTGEPIRTWLQIQWIKLQRPPMPEMMPTR